MREFTKTAEYRSRLSWFIGVADGASSDPGSLTYERFFGLREKPFSLSADPRFFCSHASHGLAFDSLADGIRRREGVLVVTGEVGTGKTTLCRAVLQSLDQKTFAAFVPDPFLSREDLLKSLLVEFGVVSVDEIRHGRLRGATRTDLSYPLYDFLASLQPLKAFAVVMLDEAQNLTSALLEEVRILSDLENGQRLLEVVLVGQPELDTRLATPEMRQLRQRVSVRCDLMPFGRADLEPYVSRRLMIAGNDGRVRFTDGALDIIHTASEGIPRVINLVCDRALFRAARARTLTVDDFHARAAVDDLRLSPPAARTAPPARAPQAPLISAQPVDPAPMLEEFDFPSESSLVAQVPISIPIPRPAPLEEVETPSTSLLAFPNAEAAPKPQIDAEPQVQSEPPQAGSAAVDAPEPAAVEAAPPVLTFPAVEAVPAAPASDTGSENDIRPAREAPIARPVFQAVQQSAPSNSNKWVMMIVIVVTLATGIGAFWFSTLPASNTARQPEVADTRPQPRPAEHVAAPVVSPPPAEEPATAAPPPKAAEAVVPRPAPSQAATKPAIQIATFESPARAEVALQQLRDEGFPAYTVEMHLRDGKSAIAVMLGPYAELESANRDLERARQIPGYSSGWIVQAGPALLPQTKP